MTLDRLLAKEPQHRYQSFREVRADLRQLLHSAGALAQPAEAARSGAPAGPRRTTFVGRETERAEARRLVERAVAGQGGVLLLGGEPGVGKTRLAEELLTEGRRRQLLTVVGNCYDQEGAQPFIPFVEALESLARTMADDELRATLGDAAPEVAKLVPALRQRFSDMPAPMAVPPEQQRRFLFNGILEFVGRLNRHRASGCSTTCNGPTSPAYCCCNTWPRRSAGCQCSSWGPIEMSSWTSIGHSSGCWRRSSGSDTPGDWAQASAMLTPALEGFRKLGMVPYVKLADELQTRLA